MYTENLFIDSIPPRSAETISPYNEMDYTELLKFYGLDYKIIGYCLQVGDLHGAEGWVLNISTVISQLPVLFRTILPVLRKAYASFRIPLDKETAGNLLNGDLGIKQLGKIISVYPRDTEQALSLAKMLVENTRGLAGPCIPTNVNLGSVVYTWYEAYSTDELIWENKQEGSELAIVSTGDLFKLPNGISWPFTDLAPLTLPNQRKILKNIYKPLHTIKKAFRGNVYRGIYMSGMLRVKPCIIKQGKKNMISDEMGRDIYDRLKWQQDLHQGLFSLIYLPKIIDLFFEDGDSYLVMEFIKGQSLYDRMLEVNYGIRPWIDLKVNTRVELLDYVLKIISVIQILHQNGYVHRDIAPGNFLIDKQNQICLIDLELAYSISKKTPAPPFDLGTRGFMSPEQESIQIPTIKEDIYGLGALILALFTGLSPTKFSATHSEQLALTLMPFIQDQAVSELIGSCLDPIANLRPELNSIKYDLENCKRQVINLDKMEIDRRVDKHLTEEELAGCISKSIRGLVNPPIIMNNNIWYSKVNITKNVVGNQQKEYARLGGIFEGLGGILYVLARLKRMGFDISSCEDQLSNSLEFVDSNYFQAENPLESGLYRGYAGIAVGFAEAIRSGLLTDCILNRQKIEKAFKAKATGTDLASGMAGQGIAILRCLEYLEAQTAKELLITCVSGIMGEQQKDGAWASSDTGHKIPNIAFGTGTPGIIWFLLEYISYHPDDSVERAALKGLSWIAKKTNDFKKLFTHDFFDNSPNSSTEVGDERKGLILTYIKAYETLGEDIFKVQAESALIQYPKHMVKNDFTQYSGLAGLGELYLEAFRVFKTTEWKLRADWIAFVFMHTLQIVEPTSGYWIMEDNNAPTADFMVGMSGIIHFLLRCFSPKTIKYRILQ
jgi:serine/threonine protein kinase